ncbi:MAG: ABC transporter substrate-binding protein [Bacillota bacterium]
MYKAFKVIMVLVLSIALVLSGCTKALQRVEAKNLSLRVGVMPAADSAPIFLADKNGYFKELGLDVKVEVYSNAANRQSALQSGELDGAMTDLIAFLNNVQNGFDIKITTSTDGSFPFLVSKSFQEKKKIKVGMMEISVSNYLSDQWLSGQYEMEKIFVNEIPARLEMLKAGQMDMACLPEPVASSGQLGGLEKRVFDNKDEFWPEAMVFTGKAMKEKAEAIKLFHRAYNKAVAEINKDEAIARNILVEQLELKPEVKDLMVLPKYMEARLPSEAYMSKIINWVEKVQKIDITVKYNDMVEGKFIK